MIIGIIRTVILYIVVMIAIRLMGKRQVGQLEPSELVLALLIADIAAVPMQEYGTPLLSGLLPIVTLLSLAMIVSVLNTKSIRFRKLMCGTPSIVIKDSIIVQQELRRNRYTVDELFEQLRLQGINNIDEVKYAILETSGQLSILLRADDKPVTASQMHVTAKERGLPTNLIEDGKILQSNLTYRGLDMKWLNNEIKRHGYKDANEVFLLMIDEQGKIFCQKREPEDAP